MTTQATDWTTEVLFDGTATPAMGLGFKEPAEGAYKVKCIDATHYPEKNRILLKLEITEGPEAKNVIFEGYNLPRAGIDEKKNKTFTSFLKGAMVGLGMAAAASAGGAIKIARATFIGKVGHVYYTPRADEDSFSETRWLTAEGYTELMANGGKRGGSAPAKAPEQNPFDVGIVNGTPVNGAASATGNAAAQAFV